MRVEAGRSQAELARALGLSRPTVTRLENADQNVTLRTLEQVCRSLRYGVGDLFVPGKVKLRARRR
jgi:transcriptional regulator with XRE-family HTH domain